MSWHQSGRLTEAQAVYQEILSIQPGNFDALHLLGVICGQNKQPERAVELISQAIQIAPDNAAAHCNKASALLELGQFEAALGSYERAIALRPDYLEACYNRGNVLIQLQRPAAALESLERAIAIRADFAKAHARRGDALMQLQRYEEAVRSYERALTLKPDAATFMRCGDALMQLQRCADALQSYDRAVAMDPVLADACSSRGAVLNALGRWEDALASCDQALVSRPDFAEALSNRGCSLLALNRVEAALASFDRAIAINPDLAGAYINRGAALCTQNRVEAARADYDAAIALDPRSAKAHVARAMSLLAQGEFAAGWRDFEWRGHRDFQQPRWLGEESLVGKTILLHSEQGLGDTIQFCRYVKLVAARGARVLLQIPRTFETLLASLEGVTQLLVEGAELPPFDYHSSLLSLPLALKTTLTNIPDEVPYLRSAAPRTRRWSERLGPRCKPRVGLVWSGGHRPDHPELQAVQGRRDIPLTLLAELADPALEFYSLQKGQPAESQLRELLAAGWDGPAMRDFSNDLHDMAETAALIEQLDLVISVDTSVAHLAGALGKPVWILNRFDTCWRWLLDREDSPWYPTARLYRQQRAGDWAGVIARVRDDLGRLGRA
jgi:tetratricopeptide (TPR) repeat protein